MRGLSWTREEVEATVADYFRMLTFEFTGQKYSKTTHRRQLLTQLNGRNEAAIELKHRNISAILDELGWHFIPGYKPAHNYQNLLYDVVANRIKLDRTLDIAESAAVSLPAITPEFADFRTVEVDRPVATKVKEKSVSPRLSSDFSAAKRDYVSQEARNASLGRAGEEFVLNFERWRLTQLGHEKLANRVEHVSETKGDGLGFDVLSYDLGGKERLIEVKTTAFAKETPFYLTKTELERSNIDKERYSIYRLFEFRKAPKFFALNGDVSCHCLLDPVSYRARLS